MKKPKYINKPFSRLPLKLRACYVLTLAGFTYQEIIKLVIVSPNTVKRAISMACDENYV